MGKSAQVPLHVWLPDSMEGPTPISALIHAATMVTAGVFMVARMSPLFEYSSTALSFVLVIGATNALFLGILGVINNDIKRVIAYSTLSQLGYMVAALGASAYAAGIFHLMTHACFKALLFLAAGSVIMAMHHEQDMRKMGGLGKYMPITAATCWVGALALVGFPFFSGYYSKDAIIEAVGLSHRWGSTYAYWCLLLGAYVTSLYTFRLLFMTFHGKERFRHVHAEHEGHGGHGVHEPRENSLVVTLPLIALAIPSVILGYLTVGKVLYGNYFGSAIMVLPRHNVLARMARDYHGPFELGLRGFLSVPFALVVAGLVTAWLFVLKRPQWADVAAVKFAWLKRILDQKYYFDWFNEQVLARLARGVGLGLWKIGDQGLIDGALVNGTARSVGGVGGMVRRVQSGYLYSYAFWIVTGLAVLLGWFLLHA
jgi:NADH-quinone oxidoreductase subunit L